MRKLKLKHLVTGALSSLLLSSCAGAAGNDTVSSNTRLKPRQAQIYIAGDSTAADYPAERAPQIGWGQTLQYFVSDPAIIQNRAVNGRSTKSYIDEGKWDALLEELRPGDFVLISFGHNDSRDDAPLRYAAASGAYRENLKRFARDVRAKGATPIIISPAARRLWEGPAMVETHGLYRQNAQIAAEQSRMHYIDLSQLSLDYFEAFGREATKQDFLWLLPNPDSAKFPDGVEDNTHFTELGACGLSFIVAQDLSKLNRLSDKFNMTRLDDNRQGKAERPQVVIDCANWAKAHR